MNNLFSPSFFELPNVMGIYKTKYINFTLINYKNIFFNQSTKKFKSFITMDSNLKFLISDINHSIIRLMYKIYFGVEMYHSFRTNARI